MIKLIVVDDERKTREGLKNYIPWSELGVDIIEEAESGLQALDLALRIYPDIIISDIRMPNMDGIELASRIKEKLPGCRIIFLTAYCDKEYLKSAIQLKAFSYIEKPVDREEIYNVIKDTVKEIEGERERKRAENEMKSRIDEGKELISRKLTIDLIYNVDIEELKESGKFSTIGFPTKGRFVTIIFKLNKGNFLVAEGKQDFRELILKTIAQKFSEEGEMAISGFKDDEHVITHLFVGKFYEQSIINLLLSDIRNDINGILESNHSVFIVGGRIVEGIENIVESYRTAVLVTQKLFFTGYDNIIFYKEALTETYNFDENTGKQFIICLQEGRSVEAIALVHRITVDLRRNSGTLIDYARNVFFNLLLYISKVAEERCLYIFDHDDEKKFLWEIVLKASTIEEIEQYIIEKITFMFEGSNSKDSKSNTIFNIMQYIQKNFHDQNLSISSIADYTFLTCTYLCSIFKDKTGKTINQYITEIRIDKAKELLGDRKVKLYDIARKVGYNDENYFSKAFKKATGFSPSDYKERNQSV